MKLLLVGNGGREHALAWKLAQSPMVQHIYVAPGNAGTALQAKCSNLAIGSCEIAALIDFAKTQQIDLTIIGPEAPLALGIVDSFQRANLACFGPSQAASKLETSKAFCKAFAQQYHIPTASCATFTDSTAAKTYLTQQSYPIVIKADGLAAGKGVVIAENYAQACEAIDSMLTDKQFGTAGSTILIETFLRGQEASYFILTDGEHCLALTSAQDHKTRDDGDQGPNTGGMGAYSPAPLVTPALEQKILKQIIEPTLRGMREQGTPYVGFLFAGIMVVDNEPFLLEYNCRLGDPETQAILPRLTSDLLPLLQAAVSGELVNITPTWSEQTCLNVVMCAAGYPGEYRKGDEISGLDNIQANQFFQVFHAGTTLDHGKTLTNGGRVLAVATLGENVAIARQNVYHILGQISWPGAFYRKDIGNKALYADKT